MRILSGWYRYSASPCFIALYIFLSYCLLGIGKKEPLNPAHLFRLVMGTGSFLRVFPEVAAVLSVDLKKLAS